MSPPATPVDLTQVPPAPRARTARSWRVRHTWKSSDPLVGAFVGLVFLLVGVPMAVVVCLVTPGALSPGRLGVLLFPLLGGIGLFLATPVSRRRRRVFRHGLPALGKVLEAGFDGSTGGPEGSVTTVHYSFQTPDGLTFEGSVSSTDAAVLSGLHAGDPLVILYDAETPVVSTPWLA